MKVMFFAHDPGGANAILPLISKFEKPAVFAEGPALNILPNARERADLERIKPDFVITGTSANDFTERQLWRQAAEAEGGGIPSMAILDFWVNYGVRFSRYGTKDLHLFDGKCDCLPRYICVMDALAKADMIADGAPADRILPFGNPHFERLAQSAAEYPAAPSDGCILFASQPFDDNWRAGAEHIALADLIDIAKDRDLPVMIRKHPKESEEKFAKYLSDSVKLDTGDNAAASIREARMVVSVNSMVLIEALFYGRKIISYQPKTKDGANDFILTRNGMLPFIGDKQRFAQYFDEVLHNQEQHIGNAIPHIGITERIVKFVKETLIK
jgi:hypothetical protein